MPVTQPDEIFSPETVNTWDIPANWAVTASSVQTALNARASKIGGTDAREAYTTAREGVMWWDSEKGALYRWSVSTWTQVTNSYERMTTTIAMSTAGPISSGNLHFTREGRVCMARGTFTLTSSVSAGSAFNVLSLSAIPSQFRPAEGVWTGVADPTDAASNGRATVYLSSATGVNIRYVDLNLFSTPKTGQYQFTITYFNNDSAW